MVIPNILGQIHATKQLTGLVVVYFSLTGIYFTVGNRREIFNISKENILQSYQLLIIGIICVFILEVLWYILRGRLFIFSGPIGFLLNLITISIRLMFYWVYIFPLKLMLGPIVDQLLKENREETEDGEKFIFLNQKVGVADDDHYFPRILKVQSLVIKVKPSQASPRWRLGIKFSADNEFPATRYDSDHPLFHLTKEQGQDNLQYHLYDGKNGSNGILSSSYSDDSVTVIIRSAGSKTKIIVNDFNQEELIKIELSLKKKAQLFAWADGISNFELESYIREK